MSRNPKLSALIREVKARRKSVQKSSQLLKALLEVTGKELWKEQDCRDDGALESFGTISEGTSKEVLTLYNRSKRLDRFLHLVDNFLRQVPYFSVENNSEKVNAKLQNEAAFLLLEEFYGEIGSILAKHGLWENALPTDFFDAFRYVMRDWAMRKQQHEIVEHFDYLAEERRKELGKSVITQSWDSEGREVAKE